MDTTIKKLILIVLTTSLLLPVSAQIIGGEVFFEGNINPNWQNVFVYNVDNVNDYVEVLVSPDRHRYSFLNSRIGGNTIFSTGSILQAEILDFENGFAAGPVSMILNQEDYNIFSKMEFREVVQLKQPNKKLIISKDKNFTLEVNVFDDCNFYFKESNSYEQLCESGCDYKKELQGDYGNNELIFVTDCQTGERLKGASRDMIFPSTTEKYVNYEKSLFSSSPDEFLVIFSGTKSDGSFSVTDFIPSEFEVFEVSDSGFIFLEDGYSSIEWKNINTESFNFSYKIRPKPKLRTCDFGIYSFIPENKILLKKSFENQIINFNEPLNLKDENFYFDCNFSNEVSFQMIEKFDFEKNLNFKLKNGKNTKISLKGKLSSEVSNLEFKEYVPIEFEITSISNDGRVESSTSNYNVIIWDLSGSNFNFEYTISPSISGDFSFISELENNILEETTTTVYNYVPPFFQRSNSGNSGGASSKSLPFKYIPKNFSKATKNFPLIIKDEDVRVAFYSKILKEKASFNLFKFIYEGNFNRSFKYIKSYTIETNMNSSERGKIKFEYEVNKTFLEKNDYKNIKFFTRKKGKFSPITGRAISSENEIVKYEFESDEPLSEFFIFAEKSKLSLKDKFMNWFDKFWSYIFHT
ncbi:hypothetical protein K8R30_02865 [archaeon]|nr:hypothetical protein [archaeon]